MCRAPLSSVLNACTYFARPSGEAATREAVVIRRTIRCLRCYCVCKEPTRWNCTLGCQIPEQRALCFGTGPSEAHKHTGSSGDYQPSKGEKSAHPPATWIAERVAIIRPFKPDRIADAHKAHKKE